MAAHNRSKSVTSAHPAEDPHAVMVTLNRMIQSENERKLTVVGMHGRELQHVRLLEHLTTIVLPEIAANCGDKYVNYIYL